MLSIIAGNGKHTMSFLLFIVNCAKLPQKQDMHLQGPGDFGSRAAVGLLQALVPALLMNICIVGMNQIFDVDIDKVNKPYLPLASGDWSLNTGIRVAVGSGVVAVLLGLYIGSPPLLATLVGSLLLGIAYSVDLPFLRWKKYPILAMGCILSVRYNFWHMQSDDAYETRSIPYFLYSVIGCCLHTGGHGTKCSGFQHVVMWLSCCLTVCWVEGLLALQLKREVKSKELLSTHGSCSEQAQPVLFILMESCVFCGMTLPAQQADHFTFRSCVYVCVCRAIMVQLGFYFHMQRVLQGSRVTLTWPLVFAMCFMLIFSVVIALFKDIPDVKGDSQVNLISGHVMNRHLPVKHTRSGLASSAASWSPCIGFLLPVACDFS